jgi:hypothetical protein
MKIKVDRYTVHIIPESDQDVAFIEDTMRLSIDGDVIKLERIDDNEDPMGFRLETDLATLPKSQDRNATRPIKKGLYQRPLDDFIDVADSWDGPPYSRTGKREKTEVDKESV